MKDNNRYISASTDKIRQQAIVAKELCIKLLAHIQTINNEVDASIYCWESDSSRLLYDYFREDMPDYNDIKKELNKRIEQLDEIAAMYDSVEESSENAAATLPDTVIE